MAAAFALTCTLELRQAGEPDARIFAVAAWRDAPYFTDAERAALSLTEAVTRLCDRSGRSAGRDLGRGRQALRRSGWRGGRDPPDRADQRLERLNAATRQVAGAWAA